MFQIIEQAVTSDKKKKQKQSKHKSQFSNNDHIY